MGLDKNFKFKKIEINSKKKIQLEEPEDDQSLNEYPRMIPKSWFVKEDSQILGYVEGKNIENLLSKLEWSQTQIDFSTGNINNSKKA